MSDDPDDDPDDGDEESPFEVIDEPETTNPFDRIDVEDRDADPFERIDGPDPSATEASDEDPEHVDAVDGDAAADETTPDVDEDETDPFAGLGRDERAGDPFEGLRGDSVEAGGSTQPDSDLWETLSKSEVEPETETHGQRRFAEVSKHTYCERCEYFSEPPEIACSHEGTDIIEFVDFETVRVADCPIVAERELLATLESEQ